MDKINNTKNQNKTEEFKLYNEKGWDIFSLINESRKQNAFANASSNTYNKIAQFLINKNINEKTAPKTLRRFNSSISSFHELVQVATRAYNSGVKSNIKIVRELVENVKNEEDKIVNNKIFNIKNVLAFSSHKRVQENKKIENKLLTKEQFESHGFEIPEGAKPFKAEKKGKDIIEYYDWASVKSNNYTGELDVPFRDYYNVEGEEYIKESESGFTDSAFEQFIMDLYDKKKWNLKIQGDYHAATQATSVNLIGKTLLMDANLPKTELAILAMYEIAKKQAKKEKRKEKIKPKNLFKSITLKKDGKKYNSLKNFKSEKNIFKQYKEDINDVVATLSTINMARMYIKGDTFKKVEAALSLEASRKLAKIPAINSAWILPYVAEKVLKISKKNYAKNNITIANDLKKLYKNSYAQLRNPNELHTMEDVIFAAKNYISLDNVKNKESYNTNLLEKEDEEVYSKEYMQNLHESNPAYIRWKKFYELANKYVDQEKAKKKKIEKDEIEQGQKEEQEKPEVKQENNALKEQDNKYIEDNNDHKEQKDAKNPLFSVRSYLNHNINSNVKQTTQYKALTNNASKIQDVASKGIEHKALANSLSDEIEQHVENNPELYKRVDNGKPLISPYHIINRYLEYAKEEQLKDANSKTFANMIDKHVSKLTTKDESKDAKDENEVIDVESKIIDDENNNDDQGIEP